MLEVKLMWVLVLMLAPEVVVVRVPMPRRVVVGRLGHHLILGLIAIRSRVIAERGDSAHRSRSSVGSPAVWSSAAANERPTCPSAAAASNDDGHAQGTSAGSR